MLNKMRPSQHYTNRVVLYSFVINEIKMGTVVSTKGDTRTPGSIPGKTNLGKELI